MVGKKKAGIPDSGSMVASDRCWLLGHGKGEGIRGRGGVLRAPLRTCTCEPRWAWPLFAASARIPAMEDFEEAFADELDMLREECGGTYRLASVQTSVMFFTVQI